MKPNTITVSLNRAGEPTVDLDDLWAQMGVPHERFDVTVRPKPAPNRYLLTLNGRVV